MHIQQNIRVLRSELFAMFRLSQRALDYSIKAYQLGSPEFCRHVGQADEEVYKLQGRITDRARTLLASGLLFKPDSHFVSSALRICSALHITYDAATVIAQKTMLNLEGERITASPAIEEMGHLVNRLMRLCVVALFNEQIEHAKMVLQTDATGQWFDLAVSRSYERPIQRTDAHTTFEVALHKNLDQIAMQVYEIADAITFWLDRKCSIAVTCESAALAMRQSLQIRKDETAQGSTLASTGCRSSIPD
jgi:phosphate uptake regulator